MLQPSPSTQCLHSCLLFARVHLFLWVLFTTASYGSRVAAREHALFSLEAAGVCLCTQRCLTTGLLFCFVFACVCVCLPACSMAKYMLTQEFEHYHGEAVNPKHLSTYEK